jgi:hypothetical protein
MKFRKRPVVIEAYRTPCREGGGEVKEVKPIMFREANSVLRGAGDVIDLPIHNNGENVTSCWKFPLVKRLRVLLTGRVYLVVKGRTHPPLWIDSVAFVRNRVVKKVSVSRKQMRLWGYEIAGHSVDPSSDRYARSIPAIEAEQLLEKIFNSIGVNVTDKEPKFKVVIEEPKPGERNLATAMGEAFDAAVKPSL